MVFSSPIFLFCYLPAVLALYFCVPKASKNSVLLVASLLFYAWGETYFVSVMIVSILFNYLSGLAVARYPFRSRASKLIVCAAIVGNLALLGSYKYANFLVDNLNALAPLLGFSKLTLNPVHLPIGISFFTFQALSYVIDVYRREAPVQKNPARLGLYISLFPQLIAGPIVRYEHIAKQLTSRAMSLNLFVSGIQRFIIGLSKKVLIANSAGDVADKVFALPVDQLSTQVAWLGVACYTLQIYFDFSGYSDMAIGLGRMFGFDFLENFNYPYISRSIREFWRRWHISLSTWFRDYVYIPLGGNRRGANRTYINLVIVFFLVGLWHGAKWTFVVWGMYHGMFLVLERLGLAKLIEKAWRPLSHAYVLMVVMVGWVFFRAETLPQALEYLKAMFYIGTATKFTPSVSTFTDNLLPLVLTLGAIGATPVLPALLRRRKNSLPGKTTFAPLSSIAVEACIALALTSLLLLSTSSLVAGTYNPFIYFRF
jgi:alginate O-acetyltransferase complex protein AlgI